MKFTHILPATLILMSGVAVAQSRSDRMKLTLQPASFELIWTYKDLPFKMRVLEAPISTADSLFKMGNVTKLEEIKPGKEVTGLPLQVHNRGIAMFYLVVENPTDQAIDFSAAPHHVNPISESLGFNFKCLCFGHVYTVEPKKFWYRIVKMEAKGSQAGKKVRIEHAVFRVAKKS